MFRCLSIDDLLDLFIEKYGEKKPFAEWGNGIVRTNDRFCQCPLSKYIEDEFGLKIDSFRIQALCKTMEKMGVCSTLTAEYFIRAADKQEHCKIFIPKLKLICSEKKDNFQEEEE